MSHVNFFFPKKAKIPRTRRTCAISADRLDGNFLHATVTDGSSDAYSHDRPVDLRLAPTHVIACEDELDSFTDGHAISEHENSQNAKIQPVVPPANTYSNYEVVWTIMSIMSYIFDVGSDIYLTYVYYKDGDVWWFNLTVIFIIVPSLTITLFSFVWYIQDRGNRSYSFIWLPRVVLLFLQLGPLLRLMFFFILLTSREF